MVERYSQGVRQELSPQNKLMEIPDQLLCLFTSQVEQQDESYVLKLPNQEHDLSDIEKLGTYRVAILPHQAHAPATTTKASETTDHPPQPPVTEGERRMVEIESIGEQGDGIAKVERGYVLIIPDTDISETVQIEITDVKQSVGFANVLKRLNTTDES